MSSVYIRGNCLEVMKSLPDKSVDCFVCDLPYGQLNQQGLKNRKAGAFASGGCKWDVKIDLDQFWDQVKRLARNDNTPVLMFCNTRFGIELINSNPTWFRYDLVWDKQRGVSFLLANNQPMKSHEMIYVFSKRGAYYKRIDVMTEKGPCGVVGFQGTSRQYGNSPVERNTKRTDGTRCVTSIITSPGRRRDGHPTEKPPALYKWLLERYCPAGGTMLDPTAGSFNSITTAESLGLHGIGIEMDDTFFMSAVERSVAAAGDPEQTVGTADESASSGE